MIEPPTPGFTGVVWEAREPDRLARELTTGAGAVPMAEAAAAWTRLAAAFGSAVVEYERAIMDLRTAWQSGRSPEVIEQISTLRDWLAEAATAAGQNAARCQAQVVAYEVALLAMPNVTDMQVIQQAQQALEMVGAMLGAPIKAVAAQTDADQDAAKALASRVMRTYEGASEPFASSWQHNAPPAVAPETALASEEATAATAAAPTLPAGMSGGIGMPLGALAIPSIAAVPRPLTEYRAATMHSQAAATQQPTPQPVPVHAPGEASNPIPMAPGGAAPAAGGDATRFPRASLPGEEADHIGADTDLQAAPAVLGGVEPARHATPQPDQSAAGGPA